MNKITVSEESGSVRLDNFLASNHSTTTRSQWQQRIKNGLVTINGQSVKPSTRLQCDDIIEIDEHDQTLVVEPNIPVVYEDDDIVAINKPHGLLVHPVSKSDTEQTVVGLLADKLPVSNDSERPGVVHRLDRDTSGVMVLAKTPEAYDSLKSQFKDRTVEKTYRAVLEGEFDHEQAKIVVPIARDMSNPSQFKVDPNGKSAETRLTRLAVLDGKTYVQLQPKTGRTHQLRVHSRHIGHPIVGDRLYGRTGSRLMLHAHTLSVTVNGQRHELTAPLPQGFSHE